MACEYCTMNSFNYGAIIESNADSSGAYITKSQKGYAFHIVAERDFDDNIAGSAHLAIHGINYCPMCGEKLEDSRAEQFEQCCADVIDRIPNTIDMLGKD